MIKISVIIPVYNVENYLRQCLDSVINQTYKNLEIICIDDCSTDNSYEILKEYERRDSRITVYKNESNCWSGPTKNFGLTKATGDYVHFADSDDWLELNAYETIVNKISQIGQVDVINFQYNIVSPEQKFKSEYTVKDISNKVINIYNTPDIALNWNIAFWCGVQRRDFLIQNKIYFSNYPYTEDTEPSTQVIVSAKTIYLLDERLYNYRINVPNSLMTKRKQYSDYDVQCWCNSYGYCKDLSKEARQKLFANQLFILSKSLYSSYLENFINFATLKELVIDLNNKVLKYDYTEYNWYIYYQDVMRYPEFIFRAKVFMREKIRKYFPLVHNLIVFVKCKTKSKRKK